jgi:protein-S-isoprenylcysteine O-methyltransferase Ste14
MRELLLRILGYAWMAFGVYWASSGLLRTPGAGDQDRGARRVRFVLLAIGFALIFLERHKLPPIQLIVFGLLWAGLALKWAAPRKVVSQTGEFPLYRLLRLVVLAITFALLFWERTAIGILGGRFAPQIPVVAGIGFALTLAGLAIALWARVHLGQNWSDKVILSEGHQLIRSGPYAYMRHPIYSGVLLGVLGTAVVLGEWRGVLAFVILLTNYSIKARKEEQILATHFGDEFREHLTSAGFLLPSFRNWK